MTLLDTLAGLRVALIEDPFQQLLARRRIQLEHTQAAIQKGRTARDEVDDAVAH